MSLTYDHSALDRLLEPFGRTMTPALARELIQLRADQRTQQRIDELAEKCNEGTLSEGERAEYERFVQAIHFLGVIQARARAVLSNPPTAS
jgi:hypothetical protein